MLTDSRITVVKIGGNVVDNPEALSRFVREFAALQGPKILVHGGGKEATRLSSKLEIPTTM
ncbi:MAG: acetylglutamate kinase, partial [Duncaniella sp.]|nr:acetylglutamate kinase [Duncaniella sp.]